MTAEEILSRNLRRAVSKDVGLASVLLYVPVAVVHAPKRVAWTDGSKMYFAERYFSYEPEHQVAIAIHEALHVALRHVPRGQALALETGPCFEPLTWNRACDAVVNHAIRACRWCRLPNDAWMPEDSLTDAELAARPAQLWTAEEIYRVMRTRAPQGETASASRAVALEGDLDPEISPVRPLSGSGMEQLDAGIWRARLLRSQAGASPGSMLRQLSADLPRQRVRWEAVLRDFLTARLMPLTETSWSRVSRRTLALGRKACWIEPGIDRQRGLRRAGVVIDTSGSIHGPPLHTFLSEINGLLVRTGCEVVLIDCDAAVQQVSLHRQPIRSYVARGGGGTDFRPAIDLLRRMDIDVGVYFTDLEGTFPEKKPGFPLLWAVTRDLAVPFGQKLLLPWQGAL